MQIFKDERKLDSAGYLTFSDLLLGEPFSVVVPKHDADYHRVFIKCTNKLDNYGLDILTGELRSFIYTYPVIRISTQLSILAEDTTQVE